MLRCGLLLGWLLIAPTVSAQESAKPGGEKTVTVKEAESTVDKAALYKQLESTLSGSKFVGHFTTLGKAEGQLKAEEYTILSARKAEQGEMWLLTARIKYGDHDAVVPLPLEIQWAGSTPIITLDKLTIPGFGTFSARVVLHDGKYAGTWSHDAVGGHLFGKIEKLPIEPKP